MQQYKYAIGERVFTADSNGIYPGTITAIHDKLYRVHYDVGGYGYLIFDGIMPLEYHVGDYVQSSIGIGRITAIEPEYTLITVHCGRSVPKKCYYECELRPAPKPSLWTRIIRRDTYLFKR